MLLHLVIRMRFNRFYEPSVGLGNMRWQRTYSTEKNYANNLHCLLNRMLHTPWGVIDSVKGE